MKLAILRSYLNRIPTPRKIFISFPSPSGQTRCRRNKIISLWDPLGIHDFKQGKCYIAFCSTWETCCKMSEIYYISLSIPHVQHAFKRGKYASEGVFPHMDHAFEQDKYTPVYTILLSTPVSTALAQHDFRTSKMYMNSFPSVLLQNTLY